MNRIVTQLCLVVALVWVTGCTYPSGNVTRVEDRPALAVQGATATATIEVDGINHGLAAGYDGNPSTLLVESGRHKVRVLDGDAVLLSQDVYVSSGETRVLTLKRN